MKRREIFPAVAAGVCLLKCKGFAQAEPQVLLPVTMREMHQGTLAADLKMFNGFVKQPQEVQDFYIAGRAAFAKQNPEEAFSAVCRKFGKASIGAPMLGDVTHESIKVWMHLAEPGSVVVNVAPVKAGAAEKFTSETSSRYAVVSCSGLKADTAYRYDVKCAKSGEFFGRGEFTTPPAPDAETTFKIAFGSDQHKIGIHRPELMQLIRKRGNRAVILTGDIATDDREGNKALLAADYLLRDLSPAWQEMAANVPVYASWDDHDYYDNDASGTGHKGKKIAADEMRSIWKRQWNNPEGAEEGIYFDTHIGPVHLIMTDTRSCRLNAQRKKRNSYLGKKQMAWLKKTISESTAKYIVLTGGTMWSDYISGGKDSWGTWDKQGREEIFNLLDSKTDAQVVLISGDRHGARGFAIPRPNGKKLYEFEAGTMGGIRGPGAMARNTDDQLFGYDGKTTWAFGELEFKTVKGKPQVTVRLVDDKNVVLESIML